LWGPALSWLTTILDMSASTENPQPQFEVGQPSLLDARWRNLIAGNPQLLQLNRVPSGYCALPQGPEGCTEYMNCTEALEGGCQWFLTDPEDEHMLIHITKRARTHQQQAEESRTAGRIVQAGKYDEQARRAGTVETEVLRRASQDLRERMLARKQELERDQSCPNE